MITFVATMVPCISSTALRLARTQSRRLAVSAIARSAAYQRLLSSLAVLEQRDGRLNVSSLAAVSAAQKLGGSITGFVAASGGKSIAEEASKIKGLDKVIYVDSDAYDRVRLLFASSRSTTSRLM